MAKRYDEDGVGYRLVTVGDQTYRQDYDVDGNPSGEPYRSTTRSRAPSFSREVWATNRS